MACLTVGVFCFCFVLFFLFLYLHQQERCLCTYCLCGMPHVASSSCVNSSTRGNCKVLVLVLKSPGSRATERYSPALACTSMHRLDASTPYCLLLACGGVLPVLLSRDGRRDLGFRRHSKLMPSRGLDIVHYGNGQSPVGPSRVKSARSRSPGCDRAPTPGSATRPSRTRALARYGRAPRCACGTITLHTLATRRRSRQLP